jgi:hypothetical protein
MHINVVVIGHVDSGKSTTTGKLTSLFDAAHAQDTHNTCRPLDLQVRRYRQAYHREVREGEHISAVFPLISALLIIISALSPSFAPRWGNPSLRTNLENFAPGPLVTATPIHPTPATTIHFLLHRTSHTLLQHLFAS